MSQPERVRDRSAGLSLYEAMLLVLGAAVGIWVYLEPIREAYSSYTDQGMGFHPFVSRFDAVVYQVVVAVLGGLGLVGVPLLLAERLRQASRRRPWGPGKLLWFAGGTSAWLLWPPLIARRVLDPTHSGDSTGAICYLYGTPLMALYMAIALWTGGRLGRRGRRRRRLLPWRERFGLLVGLVWAVTGLYLLAMIYREDLFRNHR